jgi:hypothetical protein
MSEKVSNKRESISPSELPQAVVDRLLGRNLANFDIEFLVSPTNPNESYYYFNNNRNSNFVITFFEDKNTTSYHSYD